MFIFKPKFKSSQQTVIIDLIEQKFNFMFQSLRWRLLLSYLMVMAAILSVFGTGVYLFFSHSLYRQLDKKLRTLAQAGAPSLSDVRVHGSQYLDEVDVVPWRDIFNRDQQSLEWFDAEGQLITSKGALVIGLPPKLNAWTLKGTQNSPEVRTFTVTVFEDQDPLRQDEPSLEGYVRASQSTESLEAVQNQLLWGLGMGGGVTLGLVTIGGFWLTQKSVEPIEKSYRQLKQFTADASHELRGPLAAIKASVDVMSNHPERIHPKDTKKIAAIANATTQMSHLTEDLLFLARTDAASRSASSIQKLPVALDRVLQGIIDLLEPFAQGKEVTLIYQPLAKVTVIGDKTQLNRLFSNLIENAIQYTPSGGKVTVRLSKQTGFGIVKVEDTGIGIAPENQQLVFDRFWRADKARSRRQGGTGLGLAIAQAIAQKHGGKIILSSQVNVGSCFQIRLPAKGISRKKPLAKN